MLSATPVSGSDRSEFQTIREINFPWEVLIGFPSLFSCINSLIHHVYISETAIPAEPSSEPPFSSPELYRLRNPGTQ